MRRIFLAIFVLAMPLLGCDQQALFDKLIPAEEAALAKDLIAKLAARDFASIEARLGSALRTPEVRKKLEDIANLMPSEKPKAVRTIGSNTMSTNANTTYNLTFEYEYADKWLIVNTFLERRDGRVTLEGIHVAPTPFSQEEKNKFSFENKGPLHYVVLGLAIAIPLLVIYAFVACTRTKIPRRKWLWLLFVAVGIVQFHFNWATGAWDVQPIAVSLLGAGFVRMGPFAPWIFTLAFPLGAVVFLVRRRSIQSTHDA